jgi:Na+/proline symporter
LLDVLPPKKIHDNIFLSPGIALIAMTFLAYLPGWIIETDLWVRIQAAKSDKEGRKGVLIASFNSFIFVGIMPLITGLTSLLLFPVTNGQIPEQLKDGALIFTVMMQNYAPLWLNLILSVGLIAAAMSTIDTCGNIVALSFSRDLIEPAVAGKLNSSQLQKTARFSSVLAIFIAYIYALFTDSLWDIFYLSSGILTTTVFIPVMASFIKTTRPGEVNAAIITGIISTFVFYFLEQNGNLSEWQPDMINQTGLGYIVWAFLSALILFSTVFILRRFKLVSINQ